MIIRSYKWEQSKSSVLSISKDLLDLFELTKNYETIMFGKTASKHYTN